MQKESPIAEWREFSSSVLKRSLFLSKGPLRLKVDPDGSVAHLHSSKFGKLLFGRGAVEAFKIQAGVIISQKPREMKVMLSPSSLGLSSGSQELLQASHSVRLCAGDSAGYSRTVRYTNRSGALLRLRVLTLHDPTTLNFRLDGDPPADVGVNAFNRGDHVMMDDVGDTTGVRLIGFSPRPTSIFLTRSMQKTLELLSSGELPASTAGMSGAILIVSQHDAELSPGDSFQLEVTSVYHGSSLETALKDLKSSAASTGSGVRPDLVFRCSSPSVNFAYDWARASLACVEREQYSLDRISAGFGLALLRPDFFAEEFAASKSSQRRDGLLPHSSSDRGGPLETAVFIINACAHLSLGRDRKLARKWYPVLRKAGNALLATAEDGLILTKAGSPDGWRRRLGSGYPTGHVSEVNVVAARALSDLSSLSRSLDKRSESSRFLDGSARIQRRVRELLHAGDSGGLALNVDSRGRLHAEPTVDQAVALSFLVLDRDVARATANRLLEKDFETGFGPRTVSRENALYYSPDYGDGQLGGCWTRASLSHAILSYASGLPLVGSARLQRVADLVRWEWEKMGGAPGEFPYWFDPDRGQTRSEGSDPVAASRFVEALLTGEAGMGLSPEGPRFRVPEESAFSWMVLRGFGFGVGGSLFVGRSGSKPLIVSSLGGLEVEGSTSFQRSEALDSPPPLDSTLFWDQVSLVVCVGNASESPASDLVRVPMRGKPLATSLFVDVDEYAPAAGGWRRLDRRKLLDAVELRTELAPNSWKAYRVSQIHQQDPK